MESDTACAVSGRERFKNCGRGEQSDLLSSEVGRWRFEYIFIQFRLALAMISAKHSGSAAATRLAFTSAN